jgi:hypothetical protein
MQKNKKYINKNFCYFIFIILWLCVGVFAGLALRNNNIKMMDLREKVFLSDKNNSGIEVSLQNLQLYVTRHMNTSLPKSGDGKAIQLKYSYDRRVAEEQNRFQQEISDLGNRAKASCQGAKTEMLKVECQQKYLLQNPVNPIAEILPEQYSVEFISPVFSFDKAGWLIIAFTLMSALLIFSKIYSLILKIFIKNKL